MIPSGTHWYPRHTSTNPMDISRNSKDTPIIQLPTSQPVMVIVCSMTYKSFCVERKACQLSSSRNVVWRWYLTGKRFSNIGITQFVVCIARLRWTFIKCAKVEGYLTKKTIIALRNITKRKTESLYPRATNVTTRTLNRVFHSSSGLKDTSMKIMWTHCSIQPNI